MELAPRVSNLVASTGNEYSCSIARSRHRENKLQDGQNVPVEEVNDLNQESNYFKSAQWYLYSLSI
jgi:hypothetical protein